MAKNIFFKIQIGVLRVSLIYFETEYFEHAVLLLESGNTVCPKGNWSASLKQEHPVLFREYTQIINTVRQHCGLNRHHMSEYQWNVTAEKNVVMMERESRVSAASREICGQKSIKPEGRIVSVTDKNYEIEGRLVFSYDEASQQIKFNEVGFLHMPGKKSEFLQNLLKRNIVMLGSRSRKHPIQQILLYGIDKTCQKIHDNDTGWKATRTDKINNFLRIILFLKIFYFVLFLCVRSPVFSTVFSGIKSTLTRSGYTCFTVKTRIQSNRRPNLNIIANLPKL